MNETTPKVEVKNLKHTFTDSEAHEIGRSLGMVLNEKANLETEFDGVKADYKAKIAARDATIGQMATELRNGFRMQNENCVVVYRPKDSKKDYFLKTDWEAAQKDGTPLAQLQLTEDMTAADFALELIQAESKFDHREEIELFAPTENDRGVLVVGQFAQKWFSALRVKIGKLQLNERLDSEQPCFKNRSDAVRRAVKRVSEWAKENLKEHAKGFEQAFGAVIEAHKERAE